jgi:phosphoheptose isomerase/glutaredoxin
MTIALPSSEGDYATLAANPAATSDPFVHQEVIEILYHTLWETVHVFLEHRVLGFDTGDAGFLYPFLGQQKQGTGTLMSEVADSILLKVADDARLRLEVARDQAEQIAETAKAIAERVERGGKLMLFRNGGSSTDANDWAIDCIVPPPGYRPVLAVSLVVEPANITAVANDIGTEAIFLRQLVAQVRPEDVAIGISTSGGSRNIILALEEARKRKLLTVACWAMTEVRFFGAAWRISLSSFIRTTFRGFRKCKRRSTTSFASCWRCTAVANVELFGGASCPFTREMRESLEWKGIEFVEYDVESDTAAFDRMRALSGGQRTVPMLVEDGKVVEVGWQGRGCIVGTE